MANILFSTILSFMILWIGSGIMTMVCEHTGNISVAEETQGKQCDNAGDNHCMKMHLKKLSPTDNNQVVHLQLQPTAISLLSIFVTDFSLLPFTKSIKGSEKILACSWLSPPPKQYLHKLNILII